MRRALRKAVFLLLLVAGWGISAGCAFAEKRVALIIGNSNYEKVPRLLNPANDAALIAETFKSAGFGSVELRRDLKVSEMRRALRDFVDNSREADVAVVYFAGHGIEIDGNNYLVPVDAVLERDVDIYDEALPRTGSGRRRTCQATEARDPRCLPGQSVRSHNEANDSFPSNRSRISKGRANKSEHADRVCIESGIDCRGW